MTPTAPEAARVVEDLRRTLDRTLRHLVAAAGNGLVRGGTRLSRWAEVGGGAAHAGQSRQP